MSSHEGQKAIAEGEKKRGRKRPAAHAKQGPAKSVRTKREIPLGDGDGCKTKLLDVCLAESMTYLDYQSIQSCQMVSRRWAGLVKRRRHHFVRFVSEMCSLVSQQFLNVLVVLIRLSCLQDVGATFPALGHKPLERKKNFDLSDDPGCMNLCRHAFAVCHSVLIS